MFNDTEAWASSIKRSHHVGDSTWTIAPASGKEDILCEFFEKNPRISIRELNAVALLAEQDYKIGTTVLLKKVDEHVHAPDTKLFQTCL